MGQARNLRLAAGRCAALGVFLMAIGMRPAGLVFLSAWTLAPPSLLATAGRARARTRWRAAALFLLVSALLWVGFCVSIAQVAYGEALLAGQPPVAALEAAIQPFLGPPPGRRVHVHMMPLVLVLLTVPALSLAGVLLLRAPRGEGPEGSEIFAAVLLGLGLPGTIAAAVAGDARLLNLALMSVVGGSLYLVAAWVVLFFVDWAVAPEQL